MENSSHERKYVILNNSIHKFGDRLKKITLPGFDHVAIYDVVWFFIHGLQKGSLNTRATSIAFNFLLATGPAFVFLLALMPYLPINNFQTELYAVLNSIIPENSFIAIESLLDEIFKKQAALPIFGLLVSLFFAQKGIHGMVEAFNTTYHTLETRSWYRQRLISVSLVFIVYLLVIMAIFLLFFGKMLLQRMVTIEILEMNLNYYLLIIGKWLILLALTFMTISSLYYLAPSKKSGWKFFSAGSTLATLLSILASSGFTYFVNHFAQFNKFFGTIGAFVALMLWMNFIALTLLIGFELNVSIITARVKRTE